MARKHILFSGRVQGVGFRYHVQLSALAYHLTGWVRNLDSGDVEAETQGPEERIEQMLSKVGEKSAFIRIDEMKIKDMEEIPEREFIIKY